MIDYFTLTRRKHILRFFIVCVIFVSGYCKKHKAPEYCKTLQDDEDGSFLWEVQRHPPSYFFGTIHVPYTRVWDHIPDNVKRAFALSDSVFFELDLTDSFTIAALTSCQLLPKGDNLSEVLPNDLFKRLRRHLAFIKSEMPSWITADQRKRGLSAEYLFNAITGNWQRKRPVWVMLMINSLTEGDIGSRGVPVLDLYLAQLAKKQNKFIGAVERVHEQCVPLNKLNLTQGVFALDHTLSQQESMRTGKEVPFHSTDSLIQHYNCGGLDAILFAQDTTQASSLTVPHLSNSSLPPYEAEAAQNIDDYFREELIFQRNERMGRRVAKIMQDNPNDSFFFAFGAGHFLGNHSVLDVVKSHGFKINQVPPDRKLRRRKRKQRVSKPVAPLSGGGGFVPKLSILRNFSFGSQGLQPDNQVDPAFARFLSERQNGRFVVKDMRNSASNPTTPRPFNDLWVRIETDSQEPTPPIQKQKSDMELIEESLRVWYGLPTSSAARHSVLTSTIVIAWLYTMYIAVSFQ